MASFFPEHRKFTNSSLVCQNIDFLCSVEDKENPAFAELCDKEDLARAKAMALVALSCRT